MTPIKANFAKIKDIEMGFGGLLTITLTKHLPEQKDLTQIKDAVKCIYEPFVGPYESTASEAFYEVISFSEDKILV